MNPPLVSDEPATRETARLSTFLPTTSSEMPPMNACWYWRDCGLLASPVTSTAVTTSPCRVSVTVTVSATPPPSTYVLSAVYDPSAYALAGAAEPVAPVLSAVVGAAVLDAGSGVACADAASASAAPEHPASTATPTTEAAAAPVRRAPVVRERATAVVRIMTVLLSCRPRAPWRATTLTRRRGRKTGATYALH